MPSASILFTLAKSQPIQPFDEFALVLMPCAYRGEPMAEVALISFLRGQRLKIGEKVCGALVAEGIAAFDFVLNLAPHACATPLEGVEPGTARLFGFLGQAVLFRRAAFGVGAFADILDLARPHPQFTSRALRRGRRRALHGQPALEFGRDVGITIDDTQQQLYLLALRNCRQ